jgi:DNA helicase-2/ATP-dependent DNA helicase PcrA
LKIKFKEANKEQLEAIQSVDGPLLIIAGPGTGKTFTLINRALNLVVNYKVNPSKILFSTFTDKASHEMTTRLSNSLEEHGIDFNQNEMYIGTFHSICLRILKEHLPFTNLNKNFSLKDQFDQQYFIYQHFNDFHSIDGFDNFFGNGSYWDKCDDLMKCINRLEEELIDPNELISSSDVSCIFYGNLVLKYRKLRLENNFLDFSSIQTETYNMFVKYPDVLKEIQDSIDYVMVDEYQDTNHIQEKLTLMLGGKNNNICVVGDDDQAIYRFRGATVRNILEFPSHFDSVKKIALIKNYRSTSDIVDFYNNWMEQTSGRDFNFDWDKYRYPKSIVSVKKQTCLERSVLQCTTKEKDFFCEKILLEIQALLDSGRVSNLNQIAFLFRSVKNDSVKELAEYLDHHGIPVYSPRSNMFFERTEVMLIIGTLIFMFPQYMETIKNGEQKNDSINYYKKCLLVAKNELSKNENAETMEWMRFRIRDHLTLANNFNYAFSGLVYQLLEHPPFSKFLDVSLDNGVHDTRTTRNVGLLIKLLVKFEYLNGISVLTKSNLEKNLKKLFNQYFRFLLDGGISEYEDESEYAPSGCVSFMTIHQSKGLEFPIVFVGSQSSVPRKQYNEEIETIIDRYSERGSFEELEMMKMFDFWRLFYVAFSRAQSLLIMIADFSKQNEPSKYFEYMYEDLPFETNFSKFDFESIKNSNLKNSYSFTTDIDSYMICPTQYKYFKELGFEEVRIGSTLFGTIVHETIEDVHKAIIRGEKETVTAENINKWFEINYKTGSKLNNYYLSKANLDSALSQVTSYVERMMPRWETISNAEMPVSLSQKKYIITGKVDLITNNRGQYEILDFKTEKKPQINIETEKVERVRRQLEVYAYLVEKRYNIKISGMKVYYTSEKDSNPYLSFQRNDEHIKETIKTFDSVVNKIEKKEFSRLCSDLKICKNCDLRFFCKRR